MDEEGLTVFYEINTTRKSNFSTTISLNIRVALTVIHVVIFVIGLLTNINTIVIIVRHRLMHTYTNFYLLNICVASIALFLCGLPLEVYQLWSPFSYPIEEEICTAMDLCSIVTVLTMVTFTINSFKAVCLNYTTHMMPKLSRVVGHIIAIWIGAATLAVPQVKKLISGCEDKKQEVCVCVKGYGGQKFIAISSLITFVVPIFIILVLFGFIVYKLQAVEKSVESAERSNGRPRFGASQKRVIWMLIAVSLSFLLCWSPFHVLRLMAFFGNNLDQPTNTYYEVYVVLKYLSGVLYFLPAAINPFLYNISYDFKYTYKVMLTSLCRRRDRFQLNRTYSALLAARKEHADARQALQRSGQQRRPQPLRTVSFPLREAPPREQSQNRSLLDVVNEENQWRHGRRQFAEGSNSLISLQSISNSSLRELDEEQNKKELAIYLHQTNCKNIGDSSV